MNSHPITIGTTIHDQVVAIAPHGRKSVQVLIDGRRHGRPFLTHADALPVAHSLVPEHRRQVTG